MKRRTESTPRPPAAARPAPARPRRRARASATCGKSGRENEQAQDDEQRDLGHIGQAVRGRYQLASVARRGRAHREADEVDREEPAPADRICGAVRERRGRGGSDRHEGPIDAGIRPKTRVAARPRTTPTSEPEPELPNEQDRRGHRRHSPALDQGDQAERQGDRNRVVGAGLRLEGAREARAGVCAERREHGRSVGRGDDGAEKERLASERSKRSARQPPVTAGGHDDADRREQRGRTRPRAGAATRSTGRPRRGSRPATRCRPRARVRRRTRCRPGPSEPRTMPRPRNATRAGSAVLRRRVRPPTLAASTAPTASIANPTVTPAPRSLAAPASACARRPRPRAARTRRRCRGRASGARSRAGARVEHAP